MSNNIQREQDFKLADEAVNILNEVYQKKGNVAEFYLKHYNNPNRISNPIVFFEENGQKVGVNGFMRMGLYVNGKRHLVEQSCETGVLKEHRGKSIFTKIIMQQEKTDTESEFIIGLPNENSYPGFKKMGFQAIAQLEHYVLVISPTKLLLGENAIYFKLLDCIFSVFFLRKIRSRIKGGYLIEVNSKCKFNNADYMLINSANRIKFERSDSYFSWKQSICPNCNFITARDKNKTLCGYLVFHYKQEIRGTALVVDDWFVEGEIDAQADVLKLLIGKCIDEGEICMVEVPLVNGITRDAKVLKRLQFINICKRPFKFRGSPLIISPRGADALYMQYCEFKNIDKDTF